MNKWFKLLFGDGKEPDKNDPKYKERYEQSKEAGEKVAKKLRLNDLVAFIQRFAEKHTKVFLALVFTFVFLTLVLNIYRIYVATHSPGRRTAIERQREAYQESLGEQKSDLQSSNDTIMFK